MAVKPRTPLSRDRILRAALELVDEAGLDVLTMRRLGQELRFEAMSLYNHVANKNDVIDGMLDLVLAEGEPPAASDDWAKAIRESAISIHLALRRHPWAVGVLLDRIRPARLRYMESLLGRLREAGFSAETTFTAYHILDGHIIGFSLWEASHRFTAEQAAKMASVFEREISADEYPYLREHGEQHFAEGPHRDVSAFELGLDLILDGLKRIHEQAGPQA
jgi:AcrR family transcriptional regulator